MTNKENRTKLPVQYIKNLLIEDNFEIKSTRLLNTLGRMNITTLYELTSEKAFGNNEFSLAEDMLHSLDLKFPMTDEDWLQWEKIHEDCDFGEYNFFLETANYEIKNELYEAVVKSGVFSRFKLNMFNLDSHHSEIVLPDGIIEIGCCALAERHCSYIEKITIPEGVRIIGEQAFTGCSSIEKIIIPDSVTEIRNDAFSGCTSLGDVVLGKGLKIIENNAFAHTSIKKIKIPENVEEIQEHAFFAYTDLRDVIVSQQTKVDENAFEGCGHLNRNTDVYSKKISDAEKLYKDNPFKLLQELYAFCHEGYLPAAKMISTILRNNPAVPNPKWPLYEDFFLTCVKELYEGGDSTVMDDVTYLLKEDSRTKNPELARKMGI